MKRSEAKAMTQPQRTALLLRLKRKGHRRKDIAKFASVSEQHVCMWASGRRKSQRLDNAARMMLKSDFQGKENSMLSPPDIAAFAASDIAAPVKLNTNMYD